MKLPSPTRMSRPPKTRKTRFSHSHPSSSKKGSSPMLSLSYLQARIAHLALSSTTVTLLGKRVPASVAHSHYLRILKSRSLKKP